MAITHIANPIPPGVALGSQAIAWQGIALDSVHKTNELLGILNRYSSGGTDFSKLATLLSPMTTADITTLYNAVTAWSGAITAGIVAQLYDTIN